MNRKTVCIAAAAVIFSASFTGCGKEEGTKYEYTDNLIFEEEETSIKLLNSLETEEEFKLNFAIENFETEDVTVKLYDEEENEITEGVECSYDEEKKTVSIKGDISQVETTEVDLNYQTSLKLKELKNEEFKYLLTSFEDDHGCTYLGDLTDFKIKEESQVPEDGEDGEDSENSGKPSMPVHMKKDEIFEMLKGKWTSADGSFSIEFSKGSGSGYFVKAEGSGADEYSCDVSYFDETLTPDGEHKIRFVTGSSGYGNCRELRVSADEKTIYYIAGTVKNADDEFEEVVIMCTK